MYIDDMVYKILSIDGGGVRGIYSLQILKMLEEEVDSGIFQKVDCFAGTSVGSILVAALAEGHSPSELLRFVSFFGRGAFRRNPAAGEGSSKYSNRFLRRALKRVFPRDPALADIEKHIVIPTCSLCSDEDGKWMAKIYDNFDREGAKEPLIDAALKSSAAPIYFPSYQRHVDGGVFALNPSLIAYTKAIENNYKDIRILSIGNGINPTGINENIDWDEIKWMSPYLKVASHPLYSLLADVTAAAPDYTLRHILSGHYHRINGPLDEPVELDDFSKAGLLVSNAKAIPGWEATKTWVREHFLT